MPDVNDSYARRGGRLLPVLFWAGVGLAPLAGLLLLFGNGGTLRVGAFLGVLTLVLIGLSIALRPDANLVRLQFEETLLEEIDQLRAEIREDIASASRATHQMVGERLGAMQQQVGSLRADRAWHPPPPAAGRPVASHPVAPPARPAASYPVPPYPAAPPRSVPPPLAAPRSIPPRSAPPAGRPAAPDRKSVV